MPKLVLLNVDQGLSSGEGLLIGRGLKKQPTIPALLSALRSRRADKMAVDSE